MCVRLQLDLTLGLIYKKLGCVFSSVFLFMFNSAAIARTDTPSLNLVVITAFCSGGKSGIIIT
jgi:hypothetical protein